VFDGLGRASQTQLTSDPQGIVYTDTTHDALDRVSTVSNPYRSGTDGTSSPGTTTYTYDALGRKTKESYPDGSSLTTAYCANSTLVTDPTGKWRRSRVNGLGQLAEVDEPNAVGATVASSGCPGTGEPIWVTSYTNDVLGNLTQVVQNGSHTRTFTYDSLSRLLTSSNPETGQITYTYDANGNVLTKTDARNITTNYSPSGHPIDALNRVTGVSYSNGDPSLTFTYDGTGCLGLSACQNIGHRTSMTDGAGSESWAYQTDKPNSRSIHREQRTTNSTPNNITKTTTYYLDLAGNVTQIVYPTGRTVNYTHDSADRPSTATDATNGITYASDWKTPPSGTNCTAGAVCYTPQGSVYSMSLGQTSSFTGLNISETFNNRLQPNEIKASSSAGSALDITYSFVDPVSLGNAGHMGNITNNLDSTRSQGFAYDQVNRLREAGTVVNTGSHCWGYLYTYDAWGNLLAQAGWTQYYSNCTETTMGTVTADGNNHISAMSYDTSGNAQSDGIYAYTWDGESQMKTAAGVTYAYDGDGRRAAKVGSKLYWYGSGGEVLAETDAAANTLNEYVFFGGKRVAQVPATGGALYYAEDLLGSSRVMVQANGTVCYDADFTPFGGEKSYTSTCAQSYKFEGKERDAETQNDDFGAREYSWRFGRWLSSDWSAVPVAVPYANLTNPQTLNLYSMVVDDPESFADLDGHGDYRDGSGLASGNTNGSCHTNDGSDCSSAANQQAQNEWSLSWQVSASASFLGQELKGVYDTTLSPVVDALEHPVQTVENAASNLVEGAKDVAKDPKGTLTGAAEGAKDIAVQFGSQVASGNPRAIGQAAGLVVDAYVAVRGAQGKEIKIGDDLRIAPTGNRTGHPTGRFPHYHRRIVGPDGKTVPRGSMKWHRPWEP
jgi:RHS repeat-associated protein